MELDEQPMMHNTRVMVTSRRYQMPETCKLCIVLTGMAERRTELSNLCILSPVGRTTDC